MTELREHWQAAYTSKSAEQRSWSDQADTSFGLVHKHAPNPNFSIVDVGGGASPLAVKLITAGYNDVTVVDISQQALDEARTGGEATGVGTAIEHVKWVCTDVRTWQPNCTYDVWHDRAVLHFLVDEAERVAYSRLAATSMRPSGILIVATFSEDGPEACSGLPVRRSTHDELLSLFGSSVTEIERFREEHHTPWGSVQPFNWSVFRRS
jgi:2-polyprenyl-3-methyl-5-hydroxy-6-metoxy-1,4-benzoquinol methylase